MFIYTVYDKKGCVHTAPFFSVNDASAVRAVGNAANDSRTDLCNYPGDFALYCVGQFDPDNGTVSGFVPVKFIVEIASLIKLDKNE